MSKYKEAIEYAKTLPTNGTGYYQLYVENRSGTWFVGHLSYYIGSSKGAMNILNKKIKMFKDVNPIISFESSQKVLDRYKEEILKELNDKD